MRILLDESLPRPLAGLLPEHEVRTVAAMGWTGSRNGELLQLAAGDFDVLLTADQKTMGMVLVTFFAATVAG